jgi:hypothetical protein
VKEHPVVVAPKGAHRRLDGQAPAPTGSHVDVVPAKGMQKNRRGVSTPARERTSSRVSYASYLVRLGGSDGALSVVVSVASSAGGGAGVVFACCWPSSGKATARPHDGHTSSALRLKKDVRQHCTSNSGGHSATFAAFITSNNK